MRIALSLATVTTAQAVGHTLAAAAGFVSVPCLPQHIVQMMPGLITLATYVGFVILQAAVDASSCMQEIVDEAGVQNLVNTLFEDVPVIAQSVRDYPDLKIPLLQCFQKVSLQLSIQHMYSCSQSSRDKR